jgi:hypothetical protein
VRSDDYSITSAYSICTLIKHGQCHGFKSIEKTVSAGVFGRFPWQKRRLREISTHIA